MHRDHTCHDINDPLWVNNNNALEKVIFKMLERAEIMEEGDRLAQLEQDIDGWW